ncbi:MAG: FAD binding domain-containing protein, partial [FCB group bacterium]|nr:FAD binding domain-containing protein [FCB group bacterium]
MRTNIREIKFPQTPAEAVTLKKRFKSAYFSGGTYLAAGKSTDIELLVDLNRLLTSGISSNERSAIIGAGITLRELSDYFQATEYSAISDCVRMSCASKNIRNHRTIGGEVAQGRPDSEILICFYALRAVLQAFNSESSSVEIGGWTNEGIIERVEIPLQDLGGISVQRFSTLKSVPGFVTAIGVRRGGSGKNREKLVLGNAKDRVLNILIEQGYQVKKMGGGKLRRQVFMSSLLKR